MGLGVVGRESGVDERRIAKTNSRKDRQGDKCPILPFTRKRGAPQGSREALEAAEKKTGMIPNLFGIMAESPAALRAYTQIEAALEQQAALDKKMILGSRCCAVLR